MSETKIADMRVHIRERCDLAVTYAEDGAYGSAARVLQELAREVGWHATQVHGDPAPRPLPPSLDNAEPAPLHFEHMGMCYYRKLGKRKPRRGEYYLSGAMVAAYRAMADCPAVYEVVVPLFHALRVNPVTGDKFKRGDAITVAPLPPRG